MSDERAGILVAAAWSAAVTASAEPSRFRRGREYLRELAVTELDVEPGQLIGRVQGSRAEAYEVVIAVPLTDSAEQLTPARLSPSARDFRYRCECPDWEEPCKHAVAVALAFAERLRVAPEELVRLRSRGGAAVALDLSEARPTRRGVSRPPVERRLALVTSQPEAPAPLDVDPEVAAFLGEATGSASDPGEPGPMSASGPVDGAGEASIGGVPLPVLDPPSIGSVPVGVVDLGEVVADALSWLAAAFPVRR